MLYIVYAGYHRLIMCAPAAWSIQYVVDMVALCCCLRSHLKYHRIVYTKVIPRKYCNDRWPVYLDTVGSPRLSPWELIPYNIKHTDPIVVHIVKQRHTERSQYTVLWTWLQCND